jgi:hypothetical protein
MRRRARRRIDGVPAAGARGDMALTRRGVEPISPRSDDYHIEGEDAGDRPSHAARVVQGFQIVLIVVLAVLSFAVFWLIGLMLNIL